MKWTKDDETKREIAEFLLLLGFAKQKRTLTHLELEAIRLFKEVLKND